MIDNVVNSKLKCHDEVMLTKCCDLIDFDKSQLILLKAGRAVTMVKGHQIRVLMVFNWNYAHLDL